MLRVFCATEGHDVETVLGEGLGGGSDAPIVEVCRREQRVLVTLDLDFADIRSYPPSAMQGVWVLRPGNQSTAAIVALLKRALPLIESEPVGRTLWIIDEHRVRIRE